MPQAGSATALDGCCGAANRRGLWARIKPSCRRRTVAAAGRTTRDPADRRDELGGGGELDGRARRRVRADGRRAEAGSRCDVAIAAQQQLDQLSDVASDASRSAAHTASPRPRNSSARRNFVLVALVLARARALIGSRRRVCRTCGVRTWRSPHARHSGIKGCSTRRRVRGDIGHERWPRRPQTASDYCRRASCAANVCCHAFGDASCASSAR